MKKRILISAYACEPGRGSEPGVGWNLVRELSSEHELTVVTRLNNRKIITSNGEDWVKEVNWIFLDPPKWLTFWKHKGRGVQLFYVLWQMTLRRKVKKLMKTKTFEVFHHLTFGKYWVPSGLANLGVPMVFGPVGGGEATPKALAESLPRKVQITEQARDLVKWMIQRTPGVRGLYASTEMNIAATHQTAAELRKLGLTAIKVLPQSGIGPGDLAGMRAAPSQGVFKKRSGDHLHLVTACRLIYWKGVDLAIRAVAEARKNGVKVELTILQEGPERPALEALVKELGLGDAIKFTGRLPSLEDVYATIQSADALIHPAYHEAFGQSCLESLALGVPVVCLDWGGPGVIVDEYTGVKVIPSSYGETVAQLAGAIEALPSRLAADELSVESCETRAFELFSWERLSKSISKIYEEVV